MKKLKYIGKLMILGGGLLAITMLVVLIRAFSGVPDGSSPADLAEAISPWNVFASLGGFIFLTGLIAWGIGWFFNRRNKEKVKLKKIEDRLDRIEEATNLA